MLPSNHEHRYGQVARLISAGRFEGTEVLIRRVGSAVVLLPLEVAAFDERAATAYGSVLAALEKRGRPIGPLDTLIAAHALALGSVLVSGNAREFARVRDLALENWLS